MTIITLFINFINELLSYKILGIQLINHLLTITIIIVIFKIILIIGNSNGGSRNKEKKEKSDKE